MADATLDIPKNLSDQLYDILLERMITGDLKAGDRIEVSELVQAYKISRSPVKDALNKLHGAGAIEIGPRVGHFVRKLTKEDVIDVFELRLTLEVLAGRRACSHLKRDDIVFFHRNLERQVEAVHREHPSLIDLYVLDKQLHRKMVTLAQNPTIDNVHRSIHALSHVARSHAVEAHERSVACVAEHREIVSALISGNADHVEHSLVAHLKKGEQYVLSGFRE